jgi:hypothetical protein
MTSGKAVRPASAAAGREPQGNDLLGSKIGPSHITSTALVATVAPPVGGLIRRVARHEPKLAGKRPPPAELPSSNLLTDLAARIKAEHEATAVALRGGIEHAINAGELLIEAKRLLKHGEWLPWLQDHCSIPERTAQVYMRVAKHRATIEEVKSAGPADLTLEAAQKRLAKPTVVKKQGTD